MRKRLITGIVALAMVSSLAACGNKEPEATTAADNVSSTEIETVAETEAATEEAIDPAEQYPANIDPSAIHPGSLNSDEDTSDRWYPNGDTSSELCFTLTQTSKQDDCVGLAFCLYKLDASGNEIDMCDMPLRDGGNGHGITPEFTLMADKSQTYEFDLTFQDNFTCYDFKTNTVWKRCHPDFGCKDQSWWDDAFSGLVAYRDISSVKYQQIVFNEDHTFVESVTDMDDMTGRWEVQAANVLMLIYDNAEDAGTQVVDAGGLLEDGGETADATTLSENWQQEFNITADGKVTEFGLFPTYDDDMNLTGYEAAFELTTKDQLDAIAKEKQEKAEASKSSGSPYPTPDTDNIMEYNFDGVNLEQEPDVVIENIDWDTVDDFNRELNDGDKDGYVFEVHGEFQGSVLYVFTEDHEHNMWLPIWTVGDVERPEKGTNVIIKGVIWHKDSNYYLFYDNDHIQVVEE